MNVFTYLSFKNEVGSWWIGNLCGGKVWDLAQGVRWLARRWTGVGTTGHWSRLRGDHLVWHESKDWVRLNHLIQNWVVKRSAHCCVVIYLAIEYDGISWRIRGSTSTTATTTRPGTSGRRLLILMFVSSMKKVDGETRSRLLGRRHAIASLVTSYRGWSGCIDSWVGWSIDSRVRRLHWTWSMFGVLIRHGLWCVYSIHKEKN